MNQKEFDQLAILLRKDVAGHNQSYERLVKRESDSETFTPDLKLQRGIKIGYIKGVNSTLSQLAMKYELNYSGIDC